MAIIGGTQQADVASAAELERRRLRRLAGQAQTMAESQAQAAQAETERQARQAVTETERQARAARQEAEQKSEARQAEIRKQQGKAEAEAQAAMGRARQARAREARKAVLPFTKPRNLSITTYIADVDAARKQAHRTGRDARTAIRQVKDDYVRQVDKAEADAISQINKQKTGIVGDIQSQLTSYTADLTRQIAKANSGIDSWESEAKAAINKAQAEYEAAIKAQLNRPGAEVFADFKSQNLIPANAVYESYDKNTGQLNYTIPDTRSGQDIFAAEQAAGNIPVNATYKDYNRQTGQLSYTVPKKSGTQTAPNTTSPSETTNIIVAAAAGAAVITFQEAGLGAAIAAQAPLNLGGPVGWVIFGIVAAGTAIYFNRENIKRGIDTLLGKNKEGAQGSHISSAVVTNKAGTEAYAIQQFGVTPMTKGQTMTTFPQAERLATEMTTGKVTVPSMPGYGLSAEKLELEGIPAIKEGSVVMVRDTFDVPELRQKTSDILAAAAAVQTAAASIRTTTKTLPMTRAQWDLVEEALRQGRVAEGKKILDSLARQKGDVSIQQSLNAAYREYLRKKAILDAARKAYVASLNPQPVKGRGSNKAEAAAIGVWLAQDIMQAALAKALQRGESTKAALAEATAKVEQVSKELGLTRQQINAASATVVTQLALSTMSQEAIKTAAIGQTEGLTQTQLQTKTFTAAKQAIQTVVQAAIETQTITQTQARTMTQELTRTAEQVATLTAKIKLPKPELPKSPGTDKDEYPDGTIVWNMGNVKGKPQYKVIPPPYTLDKPITAYKPPKGMRKTRGTPQQTLTFLGGKVPFKNVSFDLGVTDGFIDVKARTIRFAGGGERTNVGTRIQSTTKGVALADNPPLLHQLVRPPKGRRPSPSGQHSKVDRFRLSAPRTGRPRGRLATGGVYMDRKGTRMARGQRRGWHRIY